jgi:flagellar basal-body rod modification protein FlgD
MIDSTSPASQITSMLSAPATQSDKDIMGRDDFLLVLITQLRHQDPMEPMGQEQMIAQLTQFNILDEVRNLNTTMAQGMEQDQESVSLLVALQQALLNSQIVSLIGKEISAAHSQVNAGHHGTPTFSFEVPPGTANVTVTLLDANGAPARIEDLGAQSGTVEYRPDTDGLPEGTYVIQVEALMNDGTTSTLTTYLHGMVSGIRFAENGTVLELDGEQVFLPDVISISA